MKVLLVDQQETTIQKLIEELKKSGISVVYSPTGLTTVVQAIHEKPDVILLGEMLSDTTGNAVLQQLKTTEATKHIPVAILSKYDQKQMEKEAIDSGASNYILKYQIEPAELVARIQGMVHGSNWQPTNEPLIPE